ncbi:STAS domain-containing protein [Cellulomonas sp. HZM]|uniref:STAS domain-containing protein n=1 Tax=Cellulomonas sp. HZM TaxID=1454010 RepID=UPI0004937011|nr:STAS domain-containing protein [Cellulomonas sp. HZM]
MRDGNSTTPDEQSGGETSPSGEPGAVHVIVGAESTRIVLSGEVDADLSAELQEATAEAEHLGLPIEVDAHHVTFMDSSGVAFLARLSIRSQHRVRLLRVPPTVRFLLEVTRIGELLDVVDDDEPSFQTVSQDGPPQA